ncbi:hypothetical protein [Nocardia pseudobrasiliensis]|uniref:Uncharacterized protein n=1 Tax=Nocardia pseudobrasiliensis TaxID=45979 RepID=A0A370HZL1_9NOCA|nr:hypothetical protein [Nocardia pseudobrasiliensis]RDI63760.1 hypothetical protein DFR76_10997 [Nocardia pseudobrasiliensis]
MPDTSANPEDRREEVAHPHPGDRDRPEARKDPEATTEDQAANMDYEGDIPH